MAYLFIFVLNFSLIFAAFSTKAPVTTACTDAQTNKMKEIREFIFKLYPKSLCKNFGKNYDDFINPLPKSQKQLSSHLACFDTPEWKQILMSIAVIYPADLNDNQKKNLPTKDVKGETRQSRRPCQGDDNGHIVPSEIGGPGFYFNIFRQNRFFNSGIYNSVFKELVTFLKENIEAKRHCAISSGFKYGDVNDPSRATEILFEHECFENSIHVKSFYGIFKNIDHFSLNLGSCTSDKTVLYFPISDSVEEWDKYEKAAECTLSTKVYDTKKSLPFNQRINIYSVPEMSSATSEILQKILSIKDERWIFPQRETTLKSYGIQLNAFQAKVFISCEVYEENLNKGKDLNPITKSLAVGSGLGAVGDEACLFIPQILGGDGQWRNAFPFNSKMNRGKWIEDEVKVFDHILNGKSRHATLLIAAEYPVIEDEDSPYANRPHTIYWYFQLFENGDTFGQPLEGIFENKLPDE